MKSWPRITIITPSYNQGRFIEDTISSVVSQEYPELEYLILDGGSTDNSLQIIRQYARKFPKIIKWKSEKDKGQVDAINKGLRAATGEIIGYLNSDDYYLPGTLHKVARELTNHPRNLWLTGFYKVLHDNQPPRNTLVATYVHFSLLLYSRSLQLILNMIPQPSTFWRKTAVEKIGLFNPKYKFAFDYDYWIRLSKLSRPIIIKMYLSVFRRHPGAKSSISFTDQFREQYEIAKRHTHNPILLTLHRLHTKLLILPTYSLRNRESIKL